MSAEEIFVTLVQDLEAALRKKDEAAAKKAFDALWAHTQQVDNTSSFRALFETYLTLTEKNDATYVDQLAEVKKGLHDITKRQVGHEEDSGRKKAKKIIDET